MTSFRRISAMEISVGEMQRPAAQRKRPAIISGQLERSSNLHGPAHERRASLIDQYPDIRAGLTVRLPSSHQQVLFTPDTRAVEWSLGSSWLG